MLRSFKFTFGLSLPYVMASEPQKTKEKSVPHSLCLKPSDIPIYDHDLFEIEHHQEEKGSLYNGVSTARKEVESLVKSTKETRDATFRFYKCCKAHTLNTFDYIMEEDNVAARAGVITAGGLTGLLMAVRRGFFKKLLYASIGSGAAASACYPKHAYQISEVVIENCKTYGLIGYNFIVGAKPQSNESTPKEISPPLLSTKPDVVTPEQKKSTPPEPEPQEKTLQTSAEETVKTTDSPATKETTPVQTPKKEEESKDIVLKAAKSVQQSIIGDFGQSNPDDNDMYTTRSK